MRGSRVAVVVIVLCVCLGYQGLEAGFGQTRQHNVYQLWDPPYQLDGAGYTIGMWEGWLPWRNHPDLTGRVSYGDSTVTDLTHATHIAGILIGRGSSPSDPLMTRGAAYAAALKSWDWDDIEVECLQAIDEEIFVANNSYSARLGWWWYDGGGMVGPLWQDAGGEELFGAYIVESQHMDQVIHDADRAGIPFVAVFPSGDDRDEGPTVNAHDGVWYPDYPDDFPFFDVISPLATGKNTITVGATDDIYEGQMTRFSNWGPTDDGRIKPDLVARGERVYSAMVDGSALFGNMTGTGQAAAAVSGAGVLLFQQYERNYDSRPGTAEIKALLLHAATDKGNAGPDYVYGFGFLNVRPAVDTLVFDGGNRTRVVTDTVEDGSTVQYPMRVLDPDQPLKLTLVWIDPPGALGAERDLVNDLDLRLVAPGGAVSYPFRLSPDDPTLPAVADAPNTLDTVERIEVDNPEVGIWRVDVAGTDVVEYGPQKFALVSDTDLNAGAPEPTGVRYALGADGTTVEIDWNPVADPALVEWRVYRSTAVGQTLEQIATVPANTNEFLDTLPPTATLVAYDVRSVYQRGATRVLSHRPVGYQVPTPTIVTPQSDAEVPGAGQTRIIGRAERDTTVTVFLDEAIPVPIGTTTTGVNGMFWLDHDFGGSGSYRVFAQATIVDGEGPSAPSLEVSFLSVP